ncbi:predicted protein [Scheffersomyces stipitis CBS 6054]|uniref:1-acyl-sn-glycerol-3-phosphate acyltransferase n=1 Tax=Scheffersomyces stipitis (strain ATCC 58785 / CBS 6054 / NBRC 10063 / NRRL Y-11545) TaxID=322104 RepID=A3LUD6_PICST|nr:predicted protein [Scheffersomyces stipitis CBS 6054]ABN66569.2 predicted protein [Scheffersomyces stipitis CBS 6054]KAG2732965.1 hypothetical protein G9P44_003955 [Scheffersomyces stipitis]
MPSPLAKTQNTFWGKVKFYLKSVVFGSLIVGCALYGVIASILLRIVNKIEYSQFTVAKAFYSSLSVALGLKINVKNEKYLSSNPAIYISNHQSALDIYVLGKIFQPGYFVTGKKSLKYVPFLGWFMALSGTFFLDRSKSDKARKVLDSALTSLKKQDRALFIFPEGTRSGTEELEFLPFKKGAFHLAKQAGIPIVPIVVSNTSTIFNSKRKFFNGGEINIEILPPVSTENLVTNEDVTKLSLKVREDMLAAYQRVGYSIASGTKLNEDVVSPIATSDDHHTDTETEIITENTPLVSKG